VFLGNDSARDFRLRERSGYPCPPYAACEALNRAVPASAGVLFVGEARGSFYRGPLLAATVFDYPVLVDLFAASSTIADVHRRLRQANMRYVFFNGAEAQRIAGYRIFDWTDARSRALFERWWAGHLDLRWKAGWLEVYEIVARGVRVRTAALQAVHAPWAEYDALVNRERRVGEAMRASRWDEAAALAEELVKAEPGVAGAHDLLGQCCAFRGKDRKALEEFRRAVALGLVSSQVHYNASVILRRLGRDAEASRELQLAGALERTQGEWQAPR